MKSIKKVEIYFKTEKSVSDLLYIMKIEFDHLKPKYQKLTVYDTEYIKKRAYYKTTNGQSIGKI